MQEVNTLQHKVLFSGNQLTFARVIDAQIAMSNASNSVKRLRGLIPVIQDWHTEVIHVCEHQSFMYKLSCFRIGDFYNINSASEHGTLYQLQNKINHTNIVKNPKSNYNACGDFLETVAVGHILGAALKILEIPNLNNQLSDVAVGITSTAYN